MHDWEKVRSEHGEIIWSIIFRIVRNEADASDCYQEVFLEAYRKASEGHVQNLPGLLRWLAVRRAIDWIRRRSSVAVAATIEPSVPIAAAETTDDALEFQEMVERVRIELACLPSNQAEAFWMCCVEEMSYREASQAIGVSSNHVGVLVSRARKHLQSKLSHWNQGDSDKPSTKSAYPVLKDKR